MPSDSPSEPLERSERSDPDRGEFPLHASSTPGDRSIYDRYFWLMYLANWSLVAANAVTFRFAEFVKLLGGGEAMTGELVTVGLLGAVLIRFAFGQEIDRLGYRRVWLFGAGCVVAGTIGMLTAASLGPLYAARLAFSTGLAIVFACSNAHIQTRVPDHRRTEMIAMIGSSGFLGLITGILFADLVFATTENTAWRYQLLFGTAMLLAANHLAIAWSVTRGDRAPVRRSTEWSLPLLLRHWPGVCLLPALMMGAGFACTSTYLTRFVTESNWSGIGPFFFAYAITAFSTRMVSRTWPARFGRHKLILSGCCAQAIGFASFAAVTAPWLLILPGIFVGFGHAVLFPSVVSLGAGRFPKESRGTGTMLTMGFFDVGFLITAPIQGVLFERYGFGPLYLGIAAGFAVAAVVYGLVTLGDIDGDLDPELARRSQLGPVRTIVPRLIAAAATGRR